MASQLFPKWANRLRPLVAGGLVIVIVYVVVLVAYGASPKTIDVGYAPLLPCHGGDRRKGRHSPQPDVHELSHEHPPRQREAAIAA
jgi:hypothetical protein